MDWNSRYLAGDTPWEKSASAPPLVDWLSRGEPLNGPVLVPGCGQGHDVREIARAHPSIEVLGVDIAPAAIVLAEGYAKTGRETFRVADFFRDQPAEIGPFAWLVEHTYFCAIDPARRPEYVHSARRWLGPGGRLFAIFYLDPWAGEIVPPGGGPPFGTTIAEIDDLFSAGFEVLQSYVPERAFPGRERKELVRIMQKRSW